MKLLKKGVQFSIQKERLVFILSDQSKLESKFINADPRGCQKRAVVHQADIKLEEVSARRSKMKANVNREMKRKIYVNRIMRNTKRK